MKGTAFDWQMCMKGQTQDVFLHMLVCILQALEMLQMVTPLLENMHLQKKQNFNKNLRNTQRAILLHCVAYLISCEEALYV